jgi:hypothetical protein
MDEDAGWPCWEPLDLFLYFLTHNTNFKGEEYWKAAGFAHHFGVTKDRRD